MGALDGVTLSNTYAYERALGWSGVLIEANPAMCPRLLKARPKARVACTAISNDSSWSEFEVGTYSSTFGELDSMEAEFRRQFHSKRRARHRVPSMPLGQLLRALGIASTTRSRFT